MCLNFSEIPTLFAIRPWQVKLKFIRLKEVGRLYLEIQIKTEALRLPEQQGTQLETNRKNKIRAAIGKGAKT